MTVDVQHAMGGALRRFARGAGVTPPPPTAPDYGPVSVANINELEQHLSAPLPDLNYVNWTDPIGTNLATAVNRLGANDVLVLPEDDQAVTWADARTMATIQAMDTQFVNGTTAITDRAAVRTKGGIVGLGPRAKIAFSPTMANTYAARPGTDGARDAMVENWRRGTSPTTGSIHANFTIQGRWIGGLGFHCLKLVSGDYGRAERVHTINHYGYQNFEPGECFGLLVQGHDAGTFTVYKCEVDGRNPATGEKEGSGGLHLVEGLTVNIIGSYFHDARGHLLALYSRKGPTNVTDTTLERPGGTPYRVETLTPFGKVNGSGINSEVGGTHPVTLTRVKILMRNAASGNARRHINTISTGTQGDVGNWDLGKTPWVITDLVADVAPQIAAAAADGGTYHAATILEGRSAFTFTGTTRLENGTATTHQFV